MSLSKKTTRYGKVDMEKAKILIVDDEADIRKIVRLLLEKKGYNVQEASNGLAAIEAVQGGDIDLVIMDIMMPKMSGIEATAKIREISMLPILFLTAKSLVQDKEDAYLSGGDDYLVKPFASSELCMKVEALLRRYMVYRGKQEENKRELIGNISVDISSKEVYKNGARIDLRDRESDIFFYLLEHSGEVVDTRTLYESVWGEAALGSGSNNVMVNMLSLRKKLEDDPSNPRLIKTVWGRGYMLEKT